MEAAIERIFQIAYDEDLMITRALLMNHRGYEVTSVLDNEAAKRELDLGAYYDVFVVGHAATENVRKKMVDWILERFPHTSILALNPPFCERLPGADFNVKVDGSDEWLHAIATITAKLKGKRPNSRV